MTLTTNPLFMIQSNKESGVRVLFAEAILTSLKIVKTEIVQISCRSYIPGQVHTARRARQLEGEGLR